jgi:hypothetical protein
MLKVKDEVAKYREDNELTSLLDDTYVFANMKPDDFPQFVTQTIQLLGRNSGLHLRFGEDFTCSCFNPKTNTVTIPAPPAMPRGSKKTKASTEEFIKKLCQWRGVLNHEVGHAQFTLWRAQDSEEKVNCEEKTYNTEYHKFSDLFENGRMERVACLNYAGMHKDLIKLEDVLKDAITSFHKEGKKNGEWNDIATLFYGIRMAVNGYEPAVAIPEHLEEDWDTCMGFVREAWDTNEEVEGIEIAIKAHNFFKEKEEEMGSKADDAKKDAEKTKKKIQMKREDLEKMMEENEQKDQDGDDDSDEKGQKVKINDPKAKPSEGGEDQDQDDDGEEPDLEIDIIDDDEEEDQDQEEEGDSKDSDEKDKKDEEGDSKGDKKDKDSDEDPEDEESGDKGKGESEEKKDELEKEIEDLEAELKAKEKKAEKAEKEAGKVKDLKDVDPTQEVAKDKKKEPRTSHSGSVVVPLPMHDYVDVIEVEPMDKKGSKLTSKILDDCLMKLSSMAQTFINKVRSSKHVGTRTYQGRVSTRSLYKYKHSQNIFKTESKRRKKDAAVSIVIDCSGSMEGYKIDAARKSALVIGEMMSRAKVEFELVGFTVPFREQFNYEPFTRHANLIHYRFAGSKDWNFRKHGVVEGVMSEGLQDNDDGESLRHFADTLSKSKKERKMMIVISDGAPSACTQYGNTNKDLDDTISAIRRNNMEIYAIGIDTDAGKYYGEKNSVHLRSTATNVEIVEAISKFVNMIGSD